MKRSKERQATKRHHGQRQEGKYLQDQYRWQGPPLPYCEICRSLCLGIKSVAEKRIKFDSRVDFSQGGEDNVTVDGVQRCRLSPFGSLFWSLLFVRICNRVPLSNVASLKRFKGAFPTGSFVIANQGVAALHILHGYGNHSQSRNMLESSGWTWKHLEQAGSFYGKPTEPASSLRPQRQGACRCAARGHPQPQGGSTITAVGLWSAQEALKQLQRHGCSKSRMPDTVPFSGSGTAGSSHPSTNQLAFGWHARSCINSILQPGRGSSILADFAANKSHI